MNKIKRISAAAGLLVLILLGMIGMTACNSKEFQKALYPREYSEYVTKAAKETGVEEALIYAVIRQESKFNPQAVSSAGAIGLMQLMPSTYEWLLYMEGETEAYADKLYDPETNIEYGTKCLKYLLDKYDNNIRTVAAAYNGGLGNVDEWLQNEEYSDDGKTLKKIPLSETEAYVERIENYYNTYKELYY